MTFYDWNAACPAHTRHSGRTPHLNNPPSVKEAFYLRADARYASLGPSLCCAIIVFQAHIASQSRLTAWSIVLICPGAPDS
jgi:hypothetical protein